jgi:phosphoglycolate phosphatase
VTLDKPRALLFDWDNTLVDTWGVIHSALSETFQTMGQEPWTLEETQQRVRASARDTFPDLFGARADEAMAVFYDTFKAKHLEQLRANDGAGEMLSRLAAGGYLLGVVSNKLGTLLREESDYLGWTPWFHRLVGADDANRDKPAVDAVELALDGSGLARGPEIWFVGDTDIDMLCATNAGCRPVLLRTEAPGVGEFDGIEPAEHMTGCAALADFVLST